MVPRKRRSDGALFWGCANYPRCHGTRTAEQEPTRADEPGGSADRQFTRRRDRHKAAVEAARSSIFRRGGLIVAAGFAMAIAAPPTWRLFGIAVAVLGVLVTIERLYVLPQHVQSWNTGGEGERLTASRLEPLRAQGYVVLHDRKIPRSVANIDHIVIGPTGVWVVETKNYGGRLRVRDGELRVNGRRRNGVREEVEREIAAVALAAGLATVTAVVVVHRAEFPWLGTLRLGEIPVVPPEQLAKRISTGTRTLTPEQVADLASIIDRALPQA